MSVERWAKAPSPLKGPFVGLLLSVSGVFFYVFFWGGFLVGLFGGRGGKEQEREEDEATEACNQYSFVAVSSDSRSRRSPAVHYLVKSLGRLGKGPLWGSFCQFLG